MKTVAYSDILNRAAELAGRTRDKLPPSEATMLLGFISVDLEEVWVKEEWPDLIPAPLVVTVTTRTFSKNEGVAGAMGDILGVYDKDPTTTTKFRGVDFTEKDGNVVIMEDLAQVVVEYMLPATDLLAVSAVNLPGTLVPRRFRNYLALRGAGLLKNTDVEGSGTVLLGLAESGLGHQLQQMAPRPWWRSRPRIRSEGRVKIPAVAMP